MALSAGTLPFVLMAARVQALLASVDVERKRARLLAAVGHGLLGPVLLAVIVYPTRSGRLWYNTSTMSSQVARESSRSRSAAASGAVSIAP
jgi:hypothetical protein